MKKIINLSVVIFSLILLVSVVIGPSKVNANVTITPQLIFSAHPIAASLQSNLYRVAGPVTINVTKDPSATYYLTGGPDATTKFTVDDYVLINGSTQERTSVAYWSSQIGNVVADTPGYGRQSLVDITSIINNGANTFEIWDYGHAGYGWTDIYLVAVKTIIAPTVTVTASPTLVPYGTSPTVTWSSTNADDCFGPSENPSIPTTGSGIGKNDSKSFNVSSGAGIKTIYVKCTGPGGSISGGANVTVSQPFSFSLSNDTTAGTVNVSSNGKVTVNIHATLDSGVDLDSTQPVTLSASGLPSSATVSFSNKTLKPSDSSSLEISNLSTDDSGYTYTVTVTGTSGDITKTTSFQLTKESNNSNTTSGPNVSSQDALTQMILNKEIFNKAHETPVPVSLPADLNNAQSFLDIIQSNAGILGDMYYYGNGFWTAANGTHPFVIGGQDTILQGHINPRDLRSPLSGEASTDLGGVVLKASMKMNGTDIPNFGLNASTQIGAWVASAFAEAQGANSYNVGIRFDLNSMTSKKK